MPDKPPSYSDRQHAEDLARRAPVYDAEEPERRRPLATIIIILSALAAIVIIFSIAMSVVGS